MLLQLLEQVGKYLFGGGNISELESWVLCNLPQILKSEDKKVIGLANEIDADIAFVKEGLLAEEKFKLKLQRLTAKLQEP